jgi:hypothetical protein
MSIISNYHAYSHYLLVTAYKKHLQFAYIKWLGSYLLGEGVILCLKYNSYIDKQLLCCYNETDVQANTVKVAQHNRYVNPDVWTGEKNKKQYREISCYLWVIHLF